MYNSIRSGLKSFTLDSSLYKQHKIDVSHSNFGMDSSAELLDDEFGLYSTVGLPPRIGPAKTQYFRISLTRSGSAHFEVGLEKFVTQRNSILFGIPGQVFSVHSMSDDFLAYYMLFRESFIPELFDRQYAKRTPFFSPAGIQCFELDESSALEVESIIQAMNSEIQKRRGDSAMMLRLQMQQIVVLSGRCYTDLAEPRDHSRSQHEQIYRSFLKAVTKHFLVKRRVSEYADLLHISADHLNRIIRKYSDKSAHQLIEEMLLIEAKAMLRHTSLSVAEISHQLEFSDPSHFNRFFKKCSGNTPLEFRQQT